MKVDNSKQVFSKHCVQIHAIMVVTDTAKAYNGLLNIRLHATQCASANSFHLYNVDSDTFFISLRNRKDFPKVT